MKLLKIENSATLALVDDEDFEMLSQFKWFITSDSSIYRNIHISYSTKCVSLAATIFKTNQLVDHKDRDKFNNQKFNLRPASCSQNCMNRAKQKNNKSGYKGVSKHKSGKWLVQINHTHIGMFSSLEDAARAYDRKAIELHKEFAVLNFPKEGI